MAKQTDGERVFDTTAIENNRADCSEHHRQKGGQGNEGGGLALIRQSKEMASKKVESAKERKQCQKHERHEHAGRRFSAGFRGG